MLKIEKFDISEGCRFGLNEQVATLLLSIEDTQNIEAHQISEYIKKIWPESILNTFNLEQLPNTFLFKKNSAFSVSDWFASLVMLLEKTVGDPVNKAAVFVTNENRYILGIPWYRENIIKESTNFVISHLNSYKKDQNLSEDFIIKTKNELIAWAKKRNMLTLMSNRFAESAYKRNIPTSINCGMLQIGFGEKLRLLNSSFSDHTTIFAMDFARNKIICNQLLKKSGIPVPDSYLIQSFEEALKISEKLKWPVVIKPSNLEQGIGVAPNIRNEASLETYFKKAKSLSRGGVIIEKHIEGDDHRVLVIKERMLVATKRIPAQIIGDGVSSIKTLIETLNADKRRGNDKLNSLMMKIHTDDETLMQIKENGFNLESIPERNIIVQLKKTANISTGGHAEDVTSLVHPDNKVLFERAARIINLDIAGIDFITKDISKSWLEIGGGICEINAQPGLRPHWISEPNRDICGEILDIILEKSMPTIPTVLLMTDFLSDNFKNRITALLHKRFEKIGFYSKDFYKIGRFEAKKKEGEKFLSPKIALSDRELSALIIESSRESLKKQGHIVSKYSISAIDANAMDYKNQNDIQTIKEVIARTQNSLIIFLNNLNILDFIPKSKSSRLFYILKSDIANLEIRENDVAIQPIFDKEAPKILIKSMHKNEAINRLDLNENNFSEIALFFAILLSFGFSSEKLQTL